MSAVLVCLACCKQITMNLVTVLVAPETVLGWQRQSPDLPPRGFANSQG